MVLQIVCDPIQKGHSIEKFQHHPTHYFSSLFHTEICHCHSRPYQLKGLHEFSGIEEKGQLQKKYLHKIWFWEKLLHYILPGLVWSGVSIWSPRRLLESWAGCGLIKGEGWKESNRGVFTTANNSSNLSPFGRQTSFQTFFQRTLSAVGGNLISDHFSEEPPSPIHASHLMVTTLRIVSVKSGPKMSPKGQIT